MARKEKKYHFIYKTTNILNGKYYYGLHSTSNLDDGYLGSGRRLKYSLNKYGKENHKREIIEYCDTRKQVLTRENEIVNLNEIAKEDCMNLIVGGGNTYIYTPTDDIKRKISLSMVGKVRTKQHSNNLSKSLSGRKLSELHKENLKNNHVGRTGIPHTEETKKKLSNVHLGKQYSLGHIQTNEHKKKIREANKGKTRSAETKRKMSEAKRGKTSPQKGIPQKKLICSICNKVGGITNMKRYHFENCKLKK